jgi:hypothetical protein
MKFIRNALAGGLVAAATIVACSSQHGATPGTSSNQGNTPVTPQSDNTGSVGMNLLTPAGTNIYSINWTISNTTNTYTGTVNLGDAGILGSIEFVAGGLAAGTGYVLTLSGADSNGDPCTGASAPFTIVAGADNYVGVNVVCTIPTDAATATNSTTGSVQVDAGVTVVQQGGYTCPGLQSFSILPALGAPGGPPLQLNATQAGGTPGTFFWTSNSPGALSSSGGASPTFNCQGPGIFSVTVQLQLDVVPLEQDASVNVCNGVANTTLTGTVNCESAGGCFTPMGDTNCGLAVDGGCGPFIPTASLQTDPNNCGSCGHLCSGGTPNCKAGVCVPVPPAPCTVAGQTNCVQCPSSTGNTCSNTEALFVNLDISAGLITTNVPDTVPAASGGCYQCLIAAGCLDAPAKHQTGLECDDLTGTFTDFAMASGTSSVLCDTALSCILSSGTPTTSCAANADGLSFCYCGSGGGPASACSAKGTSVNGTCLSQLVAGFPYAQSDATDILGNYTSTASPSGVANSILACASGNGCNQCL